MYIFLTIVHIIVSLMLILIVLLQSGKAADLAGAFGGMGSQTAFGPRGAATLLTKATTAAAVIFMLTSLSLAIMASRDLAPGSVLGTGAPLMEDRPDAPRQEQPVPEQTPPPPPQQ
jgi:preprotein translocase subunit SecG